MVLLNFTNTVLSSSFLACNSRLRSAVHQPHPPQRLVLGLIQSIASGSVRLWDLISCCMMLCLVMRGRPHCFLQSFRGRVDRILLAFMQCAQKGSGDMIGLLQ